MKKIVYIPKSVKQITKNHRKLNANYRIFGCDTETAQGLPFLLQIFDGVEVKLLNVTQKTIFKTFLEYIEKRIKKYETGIAFFHNLSFDLVALLKGINEKLFLKSSFIFEYLGWKCEIFCGKTWFAKLSNRRKNKKIFIVDSRAFLPYSLDRCAQDLNIQYKKLNKPEGLGEKVLDSPEFLEYAKQDVLIEREIGEWIMKLHTEFDTRLSFSLPHLSSLIFRHYFLKEGESIKIPDTEIVRASILSYHGGKNGMYVKGSFYNDVTEIDINSAYPYAMKCLPSFLKGKYTKVNKYIKDLVGIYCISGTSSCKYNITYDENFKPVNKFENIWITSYELEQGIKYDEIKINSIYGYVWEPASDRNPFAEYVDYFYNLKSKTPKTNALYTFYKLLLNSLYGKFIQMTEISDDDKIDFETYINKEGKLIVKRVQKRYRAGGLFNPFIATLITGKTRAMIHELEHKYSAIHTATDSIKTFKKINEEECSNELGGYKKEIEGDCLLLRNKLYIHFDKNNNVKKYALHGFQGSVIDLVKMYIEKSNRYKYQKIMKVREAIRQKKVSLKNETLERELLIDWNNIIYREIDLKKYFYKGKSLENLIKNNE